MGSCRFVYPRTLTVVWSTQGNRSAMLSQPVCNSSYQFLYRGSLGAICRTQNNTDSIFSLEDREPAIQKIPKYGMRDSHMLYKISCRFYIVLSYEHEVLKIQIGPYYACGDIILRKLSFFSFIFKKINDLTSFNNLM
jgi:hypothetical protein